jgi:CheY-like chemotaxis protein
MSAKKLLCVDDDPEMLRVRKLLLESEGYSVLTATSGEQALKLLSGTHIDLVLLDYLMPGMNGDQLAEAIYNQFPRLRKIAVSGVEELPEHLLNNVDANVPKGADPEMLLSAIARLCSGGRIELNDAPRTVLCVEDDDLELTARAKLFEAAGFRVLEARSKSSALETFRSNSIDAVVLDYWLSGSNGNGRAVAEAIKRMNPSMPVIMLSGYSSLPGEAEFVDAWFRKSRVEPQDLVAEVKRLIEEQVRKTNLK